MAIRMRRGNEADFDPSKMLPGEWAVSTDTKYVRMCFSPGIVLRMATYEAFESDMAEIRKILLECQSIQTAVKLIQQNVTNSELVIENYVKEAKQYRDEAEQFRNEASMFAPEGYEDLVKNVSDNTVKIDTIIEKAELNIKNNARGSNIHLTDSAESNVVSLELYGKTEQNAYTGKNLFKMRESGEGSGGVTVNFDKNTQSVTITGSHTIDGGLSIPVSSNGSELIALIEKGGTFVLSLTNATYDTNKCNISIAYVEPGNTDTKHLKTNGNPYTVPSGSTLKGMNLWIPKDTEISLQNLKIQLEESNVATEWEPYVGGKPSPSPSYPQEIKSVVLNTIKTHRKNMANPKEFIGGVLPYNPNLNFTESKSWYSSDFIDVGNINRLSISANMQVVRFNCYDVNKNCILYRANIINTIPFTPYVTELPENTKYIRITVGLDNGSWNNADALFAEYWVQIEEGEATDYQPYQSTEITLSEPIELNGFNGVYDVVTSEGVTRRFAEVVFDGSEDENWGYYISNNVGFLINLDLVSTIKIPTTTHDVPNVLCSIAKVTSRDDLSNSDNNFAVAHNANIALYSSQFNNEADWRTFLQSNPMTVVYELATPTTEALQSDFTALKTFYPETYVSNDADCDMSITYTADAKNYIDNKIALLTTAIYNNI